MNIFITLIHILDMLLWIIVAGSVLYIAFFAIISLFPNKETSGFTGNKANKKHRFLVLFPAYKEDVVIINSVNSFLNQDYPQEQYSVVVISDKMSDETNNILKSLPITTLIPTFEKSSKAKALQFAISKENNDYDYVIILDADNIAEKDFLLKLNNILSQDKYKAIQCHRCAKNSDNEIAMLDGISEEVNNTLFRKAHNRIGLSSALIGSGMCFSYSWFSKNVYQLSTAGEDRELEVLLLKQNIFIKYIDNINIYDEKVSCEDNFQRQRLRWLTAQLQCLASMLPYIPKAISRGNINYIDKTIQQALIPRSILMAITLLISLIILIISPVESIKWWTLFLCVVISIVIATPARLRTKSILKSLTKLPLLIWKMCSNIIRIDTSNKDFIHTTHDK